MHKIQGIKLVTGEELVTRVKIEHAVVTISNPLVVLMSRGKDGFVVNFVPWTIIAEGEMILEAHAIVSRYDLPKDVEDSYIQNTTGLQIVSAAPSQILQG